MKALSYAAQKEYHAQLLAIGALVEAALKNKKMNRTQLADRMGCSCNHICNIVKGKCHLTIWMIRKLEEVLNISILAIPS